MNFKQIAISTLAFSLTTLPSFAGEAYNYCMSTHDDEVVCSCVEATMSGPTDYTNSVANCMNGR